MEKRKRTDICVCGDRELWLKFTYKLRTERKRIWDVLEPFIKDYLKNSKS